MSVRPLAPIADRPLGVIDLLDGGFSALRQRPRTMATIVLVLVVPAALLEGWIARSSATTGIEDVFNDPGALDTIASPFSGSGFASHALSWFIVAAAGVPVSHVVGSWLMGADPGPAESLRLMVRRSWVILVCFVLIHVAELVGFMLMVLPGVLVMVAFSLTSPVIALENLGPVASMGRSFRLVRRRFGTCAGVVIVTGIVAFMISAVMSTLPSVGASIVGPERAWPLVSVASALTSLVMLPVTTSVMALLYLDLRFRSEGLDLQLRADALFPEAVVDG